MLVASSRSSKSLCRIYCYRASPIHRHRSSAVCESTDPECVATAYFRDIQVHKSPKKLGRRAKEPYQVWLVSYYTLARCAGLFLLQFSHQHGYKRWKNMPPAGPSLQAFRLSLYVALPVAATVLYSQPSIMNQIISFFNYTVYPPAGPPPPTADEMEKLMKERRAKR